MLYTSSKEITKILGIIIKNTADLSKTLKYFGLLYSVCND